MIVGYTSGVFDLFHIGHLNLLKNAKKNCDFLIVGVCSDMLTKQLKNKFPVINESNRVKIVEAIKYVDCVFIKVKDNDVLTAKEFGASVIFKGDDWKGSQKWRVNKASAKYFGIKVKFVPYTNGVSSSYLRNHVKLGRLKWTK